MNFTQFENVLETVPSNQKRIVDQSIFDCELISTVHDFCESKVNKKFIVSLSGGVDSMVLISILRFLQYKIAAVHINYNNRDESVHEQTFLEDWCKYNDIALYTKSISDVKRKDIRRSEYERFTKELRLDMYKEVMLLEKANHVLLAHHKDDIVENIFTNVCRGRNLLDLAVIKQDNTINNVNIGRPLHNFYKNTIYDFAHSYQVPYFKDTTPHWSVRGQYRNRIYPTVEDAFTSNIKENLIGLSAQSNEWNDLIHHEIILPFIKNVQWNRNECMNSFTFNSENHIHHPSCFWNVVFMNLFNTHGYPCPSRKSVQTLLHRIKKLNDKSDNASHRISLSSVCKCTVKNYMVTINFVS